MEKIHTYLIIFLISWILFIVPNEIILKKNLKWITNPEGTTAPRKETFIDRILFALGLMGIMLMIMIYGNIKGAVDETLDMIEDAKCDT